MITLARHRPFRSVDQRSVGQKARTVLTNRFFVLMPPLLLCLLTIFCLLPISSASAADDWSSLLMQDSESTMARWKLQRGVPNEAAYLKTLAAHRVDDQKRAAKFIVLVKKGRSGPTVDFMALDKVLTSVYSGSAGERAATMVIAKYLDNRLIGDLCYKIGFSSGETSLAGERVLRAVIEKSSDREAVAVATLSLARFLRKKVDAARTLEALPSRRRIAAVQYGSDYVKKLDTMNAAAAETEIQQLLNRAMTSYANLEALTAQVKIAEVAGRELIYAKTMIGKKAPEIIGSDKDGKLFKLSDYEGKVRVLLFWGHWCVYCRQAYPKYRELETRYANKPFAFLGINSDKELATISRITTEGDVTWRCWWDGDQDPLPIHDQWKIFGAPFTFVLDGEGIIRFRDLRGKDLEEAVEHLMTEN